MIIGLRLFIKVQQNYAVSDSSFVGAVGDLEGHKPAVARYHWVGGFPSFVVIEVGQSLEVFPCAIQSKLPNVDLMAAVLTPQILDLPVSFNARVLATWEDALAFVISARRFRHISDDSRLQVDAHY